jgi:E3 ubiquitin-protein ligase EDD1
LRCSRSSSGSRAIRQTERSTGGEAGADRDSFSRWRDRQYFGPRRWLENALREPWNNNSGDGHGESSKSSKSHGTGQQSSGGGNSVSMNYNSPIWLSDEIEYWPDIGKNVKFVAIAAMHSELIALASNGQIHQWKWIDIEPYRNPEVI